MHRTLPIFVTICFFYFQSSPSSLAQKDTTSENKTSSITLGTEYSTNTSALGILDEYVTQPSYSSSIYYNGKNGLILAFSPHYIGNSDSTNSKFTSEYDLGAGYLWHVSKKLSLTPSFSHYEYSKNSASLKSGFNDIVQLSSSLAIKWWGTSVAIGYGWGQISDFTINASTNATIQFNNILGDDNTLELQPTIGLVMNRNQLSKFSTQKKTNGLAELVKIYPKMTISDFLNSTDPVIIAWQKKHPTIVNNIKNKLKKIESKVNKKNKSNTLLLAELLPSTKTSFGLTSINISLPITYNINNFSINTTLSYNKPNNNIDPAQFYISLGVSYSLGF